MGNDGTEGAGIQRTARQVGPMQLHQVGRHVGHTDGLGQRFERAVHVTATVDQGVQARSPRV